MTNTPTPRVLNKRTDRATPSSVYCGRPSIWGNTFVIGRDGSRAAVIAKYETWLMTQPQLMAQLPHVKGRDLMCWCAPLGCHCDVLLRLSNANATRTE